MGNSRSYGQKPSRSYEGLILAVKKTSAKQLVLTVLTRQEGLLHVLARRSTQGKMGYGSLSPLAEISFDVFEKDGVYTLSEYDCRANRRLRDLTWDGYVYSQIFVEMVLFLTASGEKDDELYRLVLLYGRAIEVKDVRIVTVIAGWQLLALTGFLPETGEARIFYRGRGYCDQPVYYIDYQDRDDMAELALTPAVRQTWQTLIGYPWGTDEKINLRSGDLHFLEALLYNYVNQCSERQMKTPELLKTGLPPQP
ncbi:DNA repair protein RecO [uncultured Megasphaera sp.]|uniref:DNA repair protein RecO n=1 Tax=uncultured Megasphaera sp. TaxID=165188 RepID=UPI0025D1D6DC|nr:recombination protein O N-terminal domain-containing protein [uncultured Megasphaera sp.]